MESLALSSQPLLISICPVIPVGIVTTGVLITITVSSMLLVVPRWLFIRAGDHKWNSGERCTTGIPTIELPKKRSDLPGKKSDVEEKNKSLVSAQSPNNLTKLTSSSKDSQVLRQRLKEKESEIAKLQAELDALNSPSATNPTRLRLDIA